MDVGDRIIWDPTKRCITQPKEVGEIIAVNILPDGSRKNPHIKWDYQILVKSLSLKKSVRLYVLSEEVELDYQYYREIKLNKLLNGCR